MLKQLKLITSLLLPKGLSRKTRLILTTKFPLELSLELCITNLNGEYNEMRGS